MPKDPGTHGLSSLSGSLRMSVEVGEEHSLSLCQTQIEKTLQNILEQCGLSPVAVTFTMQDGHIKPTTTVTFFAQKKIHEKNGAQ